MSGDTAVGLKLKDENDQVVVRDIIPGTSAAFSEIQIGDRIEAVADPVGRVLIVNSAEDVEKHLFGKQGTTATLRMSRRRGSLFNVSLVRGTEEYLSLAKRSNASDRRIEQLEELLHKQEQAHARELSETRERLSQILTCKDEALKAQRQAMADQEIIIARLSASSGLESELEKTKQLLAESERRYLNLQASVAAEAHARSRQSQQETQSPSNTSWSSQDSLAGTLVSDYIHSPYNTTLGRVGLKGEGGETRDRDERHLPAPPSPNNSFSTNICDSLPASPNAGRSYFAKAYQIGQPKGVVEIEKTAVATGTWVAPPPSPSGIATPPSLAGYMWASPPSLHDSSVRIL
jgi:hypothetical protein